MVHPTPLAARQVRASMLPGVSLLVWTPLWLMRSALGFTGRLAKHEVSLSLNTLSLSPFLLQFQLELLIPHFVFDLPVHQILQLFGHFISPALRADQISYLRNLLGKVSLYIPSLLLSIS